MRSTGLGRGKNRRANSDRLVARTARRSAEGRGRRPHPSDGARRSQCVRIPLALSSPARTTATRRILAGMAPHGGARLWQDPLRRRMGAGGGQGGGGGGGAAGGAGRARGRPPGGGGGGG